MMNMWWWNRVFFLGVAGLFSCQNSSENESPEITISENIQHVFFVYEDEFTYSEKQKLEAWISFTSDCAQSLLGQYPIDLYYHFKREDSVNQAVIFGRAQWSDSIHSATFYVNPAFSLKDFKSDWIAPHEISHLALPKLPKKDLWFYEGFATYMSRQIMIEMDEFTAEQVDSINLSRIVESTNQFISNSTLEYVADSLISNHHQYAAVYWMGASFFVEAEAQLKTAGKLSLVDILKKFQDCCRKPKMTTLEIVESFDQISGTDIFVNLFAHYTELPVKNLLMSYRGLHKDQID